MYDAYCERRAWLVPALNDLPGICCADPDGAFYVFPDVSAYFGKARHHRLAVVRRLSSSTRPASRSCPAPRFGADEFVRISYATSMERMREGVRRHARPRSASS